MGAGLRDPEGATTLTPNICPTCDTQLDPSAKACPGCGVVFAPDAKSVEDRIQDDIKRSYAETDPDDAGAQGDIADPDDATDDPGLKQKIHQKIDQMDDDKPVQLRQEQRPSQGTGLPGRGETNYPALLKPCSSDTVSHETAVI